MSVGAGSLLEISNGPDAIDTTVLPEGQGFSGVAARRSATLACETVAEDATAAAVSRGRRSFLMINSFPRFLKFVLSSLAPTGCQ
ncbi:hypothetical protein [Nonomuraea sp. NPDC050783]|uniref:hypothetical protein n=1 Tax=Nonomuraea sp. NPDC050783 TaxID=3154634 RepID=UPI00346630D8